MRMTRGAANTTELPAKIDCYLTSLESLGFSGAIIVRIADNVVLRKGYGLANRETRRPYLPSTVQSHGSVTKQMTAAAILLLESRGHLSVSDLASDYLGPIPEDKKGITLHHLLTHASGLPGGLGSDEEPVDSRSYVKRAMAVPLEFKPGKAYLYSNVGYSLLGLIVEEVTRKNYESFLRDEILMPAGLADTGYVLPNWNSDRLAQGYRNGQHWGLVYRRGWLTDGPGWNLRANGCLHTTVDDMGMWLSTVTGKGVFTPQLVRRWTEGRVQESQSDSQYAYGWVISDTAWGAMISHSGSNQIFSADFFWLSDLQLFVYIQGNTSLIPARGQRERILSAAFNKSFRMPPRINEYPAAAPQDAKALEGVYDLEGGAIQLTADDTRLVAKLWGQPPIDLMLGYSQRQRAVAAEYNRRTAAAMGELELAREDALRVLLSQGEEPTEPTRVLLDRISQCGVLERLHVIGSFENRHGSRFEDLGPWTTFVYAEFKGWNQYWNIIWTNKGTYRETVSGPWPTFILVPMAKGRYTAVQQEPPWDTLEVVVERYRLRTPRLCATRRHNPRDSEHTTFFPSRCPL